MPDFIIPEAGLDFTPLAAALAYEQRGWAVVPLLPFDGEGRCACGAPKCKPGKHAGMRWKLTPEWRRATPVSLQRWYRRNPAGGLGIITGSRSGICVLDVDTAKGGRLDDLLAFGALPATYSVQSGSGGLHVYLRWRKGIGSPTNVLPHIDVRGEKGMIVAPPSPHISGGRYAPLNHNPIADTPYWLYRLLVDATEGYGDD